MKRFFRNFMESMVLGMQFLALMVFGLIFIISPDLAVKLGVKYFKLRTVLS